MKYLVVSGRILYSLIFLRTVLSHFSAHAIDYILSNGVPASTFFAPFSGILAFAGALSIVTGYKANWGAWLIVLFLVPVTLILHDFWNLSDPQEIILQKTHFLKNISMLGAALLIAYFGTGPLSLDSRVKRKQE